MKVLWTESAITQLQAIHDYLEQTSPEYAIRIVDRLTLRSIQIAKFPFSGRMVPEYELNEIREVIEGSYRIIYSIESEHGKVEVLAVIHGAREQLLPIG